MKLAFTKMQALGNDYIFINGFEHPELIEQAPKIAPILSDRHFGIGGDGIIFAAPSKNCDCAMRMFNADGSESEMCGNGIRQLALYVTEKGLVKKPEFMVETLAGTKIIKITPGPNGPRISVDMGAPILDPVHIPSVAEKGPEGFAQVILEPHGREFEFTLVSMGNPHAVTFMKGITELDVEKYGKAVEWNTEVFPRRTNVEFIEVLSRKEINMRVWERGTGETLACGTGACASVVAGQMNGLLDASVTVHLLGGDLLVEWSPGKSVIMTGSARIAFEGEVEIGDIEKNPRM